MLLACLGAAALVALPARGPAAATSIRRRRRRAPPAIVGFAPGLLGYALFALLSRALYARGATVAAAVATAAGWAVAAVVAALALDRGLRRRPGVSALGAGQRGRHDRPRCGCWSSRYAGHAGPERWPASPGRPPSVSWPRRGRRSPAGRRWPALGQRLGGTPAVVGASDRACWARSWWRSVFAAVAYPLDRRDVAPLAATLSAPHAAAEDGAG